MFITDEWIAAHQPCEEALDWWDRTERDALKILANLIAQEKYPWANWFIVRIMTRAQYLAYAIFAAEQVLEIFEKKYPSNQKPRLAIEAAEKVLENDTPENRKAAADAAYAAYDAAYAAYDAAYAAYDAYAAYAAAAAAAAADYAADAASYAADAAHDAAAAAAKNIMYKKILEYGINLIEK